MITNNEVKKRVDYLKSIDCERTKDLELKCLMMELIERYAVEMEGMKGDPARMIKEIF